MRRFVCFNNKPAWPNCPHSPVTPQRVERALWHAAGVPGGARPDPPAAAAGPQGAPDHGAGHGPSLVPGRLPLLSRLHATSPSLLPAVRTRFADESQGVNGMLPFPLEGGIAD